MQPDNTQLFFLLQWCDINVTMLLLHYYCKKPMPATPSIGKFFNFLILFLFIPPKAIIGLENCRAINPNFMIPSGLE